MKETRGCFMDKDGNAFRRNTLKAASKDLQLIFYQLNSDKILDQTIRWQLNNFFDFIVHFKKVENVDLSEPIILNSEGYVMDGWHRIIKATINGMTELPAKQFKVNPKPDFKIKNKSLKSDNEQA